ncbi:PPC domain-containing protein [Cyanobacteria bacterium FACHB-471]|nr:PPC domain-containing protein [Cyanobacteria bacterium FACHB-471]
MRTNLLSALIKLAIGSVLPAASFLISQAALADAVFPVDQVLPQLQQGTRVPILLPNQVPLLDQVYFDSTVEENSYSVDFVYTPDCQATACYAGTIRAERGGQLPTLEPGESFQTVQLAGGVRGQFVNFCGAYCTAVLSWQSEGVLYEVILKNGAQEELVQIANSAIEAGFRSTVASGSRFTGSGLILQETGALDSSSPLLSSDGSPYQEYQFQGQAGQAVTITMESNDFDTYLLLVDANSNVVAENDDISTDNFNSEIRTNLPRTGTYYVVANSYDASGRGSYIVTVR